MADILSLAMKTSPKDRLEALCDMALSHPSIIAENVTPPLCIVKLSPPWQEEEEH